MTLERVLTAFSKRFPGESPLVVEAPGRVNLIGEHTDYNDGFVLPMAVDAKITLAGNKRDDQQVHLYSLDFEGGTSFALDNITKTNRAKWSNYIRGMCVAFQQSGIPLTGMNIVLQGNIPQGAGLSSSAALEVGTGVLIDALHGSNLSKVKIVQLAQEAENDFVGVQCGIMDQFISMLGAKDQALFLDCRSLDYRHVPLPLQDHSVVVVDSGVSRGLADSEYNKRREQCGIAVELLKKDLPSIKALRDVPITQIGLTSTLPPEVEKRARHVISENQRVLDSMSALKNSDLATFGQLMYESHYSLRDDYEVSCPELDTLVQLAQEIPGTLGSRMTGGGFGGCTVSIVSNASLSDFKSTIARKYQEKTGKQGRIFVFTPSEGARRLC